MAARRRVDTELVRRGLVASRAAAREAIDAGLVTADGAPVDKAARQVLPSQALVVAAPPRRYVSRGGGKLAHALERFDVAVAGRRALDAGISTGGFTDCLLQHGAARVIGVDVGYGQVAERVRTDPRVEVRERTNVRELTPADLEEPADLVVCDVSFIALTVVLPVLVALAAPDGDLVALVKPQFEAGREDVGSGGVVRDPAVWRRVLREVARAAAELGWAVIGVTASPLPGPAGNVEFLVHARPAPASGADGADGAPVDRALADAIDHAVDEGRAHARDAGVQLVEAADEVADGVGP